VKQHELVILQGAQSDLLSIYATKGRMVYGLVDVAFGLLREFPLAGPVYYRSIRRLLVTKTNLGIFYSVTGQRVMVGAILDLRQSRRAIRSRLRQL
jgi:hypothetical protein